LHEIRHPVFGPVSANSLDSPGTAGCSETPRYAIGARWSLPIGFAYSKEKFLMNFQTLGLAEPLMRALADLKFETPTPIQAAAIPPALEGRDLIGIAQTGTGKTAAFALPILNALSMTPKKPQQKACRVLVLSPTRELSGQIVESFKDLGRHLRLSVALVIGGVPMGRQIRTMQRGSDILVATPGRLLDLCRSGAVRLNEVDFLVLDEADRMLDMGFIHDIRRLVAMLPKERQTLFFSATMPPEIAKLAREMLTDPVTVAVTPAATTAERIDQRAIRVEKAGKPALLAEVLRGEPIDRALVFARTKHGADKIVRGLEKSGIPAEAIHGNKSQSQRERALAAFRDGRVRTLVATDIAARGIDVVGISHVINYDLPNIPESYVHRIGRTARAGREGVAISFCDREEVAFLRAIEKLIRLQIPTTGETAPVRQGEAAAAAEQRPQGNRPPRRDNGRNPNRRSSRRPERREKPQEAGAGRREYHPLDSDRNIGSVAFMRTPRRGNSRADQRN
jgi:ATP-dependent RNA helicase RhlE